MKNISLFRIIGLITCLTLFLSCSAEDGEIGPQGPQGEQGEQGLQGEPGNSNVIASDWFGIETWETDLTFLKRQTILELTNTQLQRGVILIYRKSQQVSGGTSLIELLPRGTSIITSINIPDNLLQIVVRSDGTEILPIDYLPPSIQFRYVIFEPPSTSGKGSSLPNFSKMSYKEVVEYLGLEP